jgi:CRP-like cAMP-binding protein
MVKFGVQSHRLRGAAFVRGVTLGMANPHARRLFGNRFLDALPPEDADAIARIAELRTWTQGTQLARRGDPVDRVYFPIGGSIAHLDSHTGVPSVEVAAIDRDGVSAFEALFGVSSAQFTRLTLVPLAAVCVEVRPLGRISEDSGAFRELLGRYAVASIRQAGLRAACRGHHLLEHRLAGWIHALHETSRATELRVTHALAARLLGAERAGITRAYARIARTGAIRYERGRISVRDAASLAAASCGCLAESRSVLNAVYE